MRSKALPSFWKAYENLPPDLQKQTRKAYETWQENPFHPSLRFKCINKNESIWSVRITRGVRALGILDANTVVWFWVGSHDDYERYFG